MQSIDIIEIIAARIQESLLAYPFCELEDRNGIQAEFESWKSNALKVL